MAGYLRIGAIFALVFVAGCAGSGGSSSMPAASASRSARHVPLTLQGGAKHVFLADAVFNIVTIFNRDGSTGTLTGFQEPQGLTSDASGNLYVSDTNNARIAVFAPPYHNTPTSVLADSGEWPVDVAVAEDGTVALVNICRRSGSQCGGPGSIVFYANNQAQTPCATVRGKSSMTGMTWDGFDKSGNLYFTAVLNYTKVVLARISGECKATSVTVLKPDTSIAWAAGIQVDTNDNVVIINGFGVSGAPSIDVFKASPPSRKLKLLSQAFLDDSSTIVSFALTKDGSTLYTAEPHDSVEYPYPQGGYDEGQLSPPSGGDLIEGVAVVPPAVP